MALPVGSDELLHAVWSSDPTIVTLSAVSARTAALTAGTYYLVADVACWFKQGGSAVAATTVSNYLPAGASVVVRIPPASEDPTATLSYVAAIAAGAGSLYFGKPV